MAAPFGRGHRFPKGRGRILESSQAFVADGQGVQNPAQLQEQRQRFQNRDGPGESFNGLDELAPRECALPKCEVGQGNGLGSRA